MSSGLTSYPRTGGGGGSALLEINRLLAQLATGSIVTNDRNAARLIRCLKDYAASRMKARAYADVIAKARAVIDALCLADHQGRISLTLQQDAMTVCADAYKAGTPLSSTSLDTRSQAALTAVLNAATTTALRGAKEEVGITAWLYEASAIMGRDLNLDLQNQCQFSTPAPNWQIGRSANNALIYLEPVAAYTVNVMIAVPLPGAAEPLIIVGEAKGGKSTYGTAGGPKDLHTALTIKPPTSQNTIEYAVSRALYMQRAKGNEPHHIAKREAGRMIIRAYQENRLVFVAARGDVTAPGIQSTKRDALQCK